MSHAYKKSHILSRNATRALDSKDTKIELEPRVQTEFMELPGRGRAALHSGPPQPNCGQTYIPATHTPKLESAHRVKNIYFFSKKISYFPGKN